MTEQRDNQNKKYASSIIRWLIVLATFIAMVALEKSGILSFDEFIDTVNIIDFGVKMLIGICCTYLGISWLAHSVTHKSTEDKNDNSMVKYIPSVMLIVFGIWMIFNQLQIYNIVKMSFNTSKLLLYLVAFASSIILWIIGYNDTRLLNKGFCKLDYLEKIRARCVSINRCVDNNKVYYKAIYEYSVSCENYTYVDSKKYKEKNRPEVNSYIEVYYSRDKKKAVTRRNFYKGIRYMIYGAVILLITIYVGINVGL